MKASVAVLLLLLVSGAFAEVLFHEDFATGNLDAWTRDPGNSGWTIYQVDDPDNLGDVEFLPSPPFCAISVRGIYNESLISPPIQLTSNVSISFFWAASYTWFVFPHNTGDIYLKIREADGPGNWVELWNEEDEGRFDNWEWNETTLELDGSWNGKLVELVWQVVTTNDKAAVYLDEITVFDDLFVNVEETSFGEIKALFR